MGCFIIKVNGSLRVDSGKHYLGSLSFGGFECVSNNAVPGNYNYDNCGFIDSGDYTHIGKGTLLTQLISDVKLFVNEIVNLYNKSK